MSNIQMVDLYSQYLDIKENIDTAIQEVIESTDFINGQAVKDFAKNLGNWNDSKFVIPCANGTDGLQIAIMSLDIKSGDEIIVPAFTYISTVEVIALLRIKPVFVDVDPNTFNIRINDIKKVLTSRTKAIIPTHLYGQCPDMNSIIELADKNHIHIIEDLAQAIGSEYNGIKAGNLGHVGVTSFFPSKNLGSYGDGGALFTNDEKLARKIKMISNHGQSQKYYHDFIGVNSRLDTIQAAILNEKLKKLNGYIKKRQEVAAFYDLELADLTDKLEIPYRTPHSSHVFHQYTLKINEKRDRLKEYLAKYRIPTMIYYPLPIPRQRAYAYYTDQKFYNADMLATKVLSLPIHTHLKEEDQKFICDTIKKFYK